MWASWSWTIGMKGLGCNCHFFAQPNEPETLRDKHVGWPSQTYWLVSVRETTQQVPGGHLTKGKDKIFIELEERVKFKWNLNETIWMGLKQSRPVCNGVKSGLDCEVDPGSCSLGNHQVSIYMECCVQKPLTWSSAWKLEIKPPSLCQDGLDLLGKSRIFHSYWYMFN